MTERLSLFGADGPGTEAATGPVPSQTLFFAVLPPAEIGDRITGQRQQMFREMGLTGNVIARDRLHLTLTLVPTDTGPLGEVVSKASAAASSVTARPFDVRFDRVLAFRSTKPKMPVVLASTVAQEALCDLKQRLDGALARAGLKAPRAAASFTPHVTLGYCEGFGAEQAVEPLTWRVEGFALVLSFVGQTRHEHLGTWQLR